MQLIKSKPSHWYSYRNGEFLPCYEIPKKSGEGMKKPNITDAIELGLLPGVTNFLQIIDKPGINIYKQTQIIHAALTLPRKDDESEDEFAVRAIEDAEAQSEQAMQFGSDIHAAIEAYLAGEPLLETDPFWPFLKDFVAWAKDEITSVLASEQIVGIAINGLAYAGRMDLLCRLKSYPGITLIDAKTQRVKKDAKGIKKPVFYPEWILQLCAYAATHTVHKIICEHNHCSYPTTSEGVSNLISVVIDSSEPGPVFVKRWEDSIKPWHAVRNAYDLWCFFKEYTPTVKQSQPES